MTTFKQIVEGVEENNSINDGKWSDWQSAHDIINVYGPLSDDEISEEKAMAVLNQAIQTNGQSLPDDLRALQREIWGQNFAGSWWNRES